MRAICFSILILAIASVQKCNDKARGIPDCIQHKIDGIKKEPGWNPAAEVYEYEYRGKRVFYFSSDCCDKFNEVYDENCNYLCAPSGGFTGKGDKKCEDFNATAKKIKLIWKDERNGGK
jgi:hypothetical protein